MDKAGESPEETVKRELLEETGYAFNGVPRLLLEGPFNAGLLKDEMMVFFAKNVQKIREPQLEPSEDITVINVPLEDLVSFCTDKHKDAKVDIKILSVLPILQKEGLI